ncbi:MAG: hypothetical protein K2J39_06950, partial [Ruminococcus sp.]|nr:hypothetical protein [Ruminococcus sp.]
MNDIQIFNHEKFGRIRTVVIDGETWFCGRDVCNALGYRNGSDTIKKHCNQKGVAKRYTLTKRGSQMMTYINEPNLYRLIAHSKLEKAQEFEIWIFEEVLPTIRKTGGYGYQKCIDCRIFEKLNDMHNDIISIKTEFSENLNEKTLKEDNFRTNNKKGVNKMNEIRRPPLRINTKSLHFFDAEQVYRA